MPEAAASGFPAEERGFDALGDANRREILRILSSGDKPVREIADAMTISRPAVSRHLRLLKDAGMVEERAQGTRRIYRLQEHGIEAVQEYLTQVWGDAAARVRLLAENTGPSRSEGGSTEEAPGS
jgi:DNA-binding transcriptional ArsR family regulator